MAKKMVSFCDSCNKTVEDAKDLTPAKIGEKKMELCAACVLICTSPPDAAKEKLPVPAVE